MSQSAFWDIDRSLSISGNSKNFISNSLTMPPPFPEECMKSSPSCNPFARASIVEISNSFSIYNESLFRILLETHTSLCSASTRLPTPPRAVTIGSMRITGVPAVKQLCISRFSSWLSPIREYEYKLQNTWCQSIHAVGMLISLKVDFRTLENRRC